MAAAASLALLIGCASGTTYSRTGVDGASGGSDVEPGDASTGGAAGGAASTGSGGMVVATGGATGSGGVVGTGSGGMVTGSGGRATGGAVQAGGGSGGGPATGGMMMATGGMGTGGQATGGQATGGMMTSTGGMTTSTGGMMTSTGGMGTGGRATGGAAPTHLILSIDFVGGRTTAAMAMADSEMAGARPAAHWNSASGAMGSLGNMTLSDGTTSTASISWNAPVSSTNTGTWTINYTDAPGDVRMMNGYLDPTWASIPTSASTLFTVTGLPSSIASGTYDVYVYAFGGVSTDMRSYQYGLGSKTYTVDQESAPAVPPPSPFPYASANSSMVGTHVIFSGVTGASFSVTARPVSGTNSRYRAPVNGIQIVWPSGS